MHLINCGFHALYLLQAGLRLIIVIDSSKDTLNKNDINALYLLQLATYIKNEFKNLQTGFKGNRRGFGYVLV